jgi:hypothetical protein
MGRLRSLAAPGPIKGFTGLGQTHIKGRKDFAARMDQLIAEARAEQERARAAKRNRATATR